MHPSTDRRPALLLVAIASLTLAVAEAGFAQTQIQPDRITPSGSSTSSGRPAGPNAPGTAAGRGAALGDGNRMGGQTFQWSRSSGSGMAMGAGNRLDSNTQVGSGRSNNATTPVDYNSRNLLVTGNVAGGRGFRGSVGYTADTDFRGKVGSDATFKFEADSAYSNIVFNSSSLSRDRFLVAQGLGAFEYRRESTPIGMQAQRAAADQSDSRLRLDRANTAMSLGRLNWEVGEDRTVATGTGPGGDPIRYIVSPLRGLQTERLTDPVVRSGLSLYEQARARQEIAMGLAKPEDFTPRARRRTRHARHAVEADRCGRDRPRARAASLAELSRHPQERRLRRRARDRRQRRDAGTGEARSRRDDEAARAGPDRPREGRRRQEARRRGSAEGR
jgi:hypothetical protein